MPADALIGWSECPWSESMWDGAKSAPLVAWPFRTVICLLRDSKKSLHTDCGRNRAAGYTLDRSLNQVNEWSQKHSEELLNAINVLDGLWSQNTNQDGERVPCEWAETITNGGEGPESFSVYCFIVIALAVR